MRRCRSDRTADLRHLKGKLFVATSQLQVGFQTASYPPGPAGRARPFSSCALVLAMSLPLCYNSRLPAQRAGAVDVRSGGLPLAQRLPSAVIVERLTSQHGASTSSHVDNQHLPRAVAAAEKPLAQAAALTTVSVGLGERSYPIHIGSQLLDLGELLAQHIQGNSALIVTNTTVAPLYLSRSGFASGPAIAKARAAALFLEVYVVSISLQECSLQAPGVRTLNIQTRSVM